MFCTRNIFTALLLFLSVLNATSQKLTVRGKLLDDKGSPVPFATVMIKGTKTGVQTSESGEFTLKPIKIPVTVVCSMVGYVTTEKKLTGKDFKDSTANITIIVKEASSNLDEVVVVGYGTAGEADSYYSADAAPAYLISEAIPATGIKRTARPMAEKSKSDAAFTSTDAKAEFAYKDETTAIPSGSTKNNTGGKRSNLLTAGEVNDFKKWTMWEDYNETDFKIHSEKWGLYATQRYSVQLQNNDFRPVTGQKVYLINASNGDTLWTAVSDNTGKAELWKGFSKTSKENNLVIAVQQETKQFAAVPFTQGINRIILNRACTVSNKVEIAFVVDATGSMQDEIDYLKEELEDILTKISVKDPSLDLHTGAVFYRDKGDEYLTRVQQFSAGIANTIGFIKKQVAGGGGDYPEALSEALQDATGKLQWNADARTRIIFLLMDAPPHDEAKMEMEKLISNAAAQGIRIVPVACSGTDKATEFIMRSMALATNGTYLFLTDDSGIGNGHIKPTTDEFKVELLNDLLQRTIEQMCYVNTCDVKTITTEPLSVYNNTEKVKLFPNPTSGPVTLETNRELKEIFVSDFTGKILMRTVVKDKKGNYAIDLSAFPSATYFIRYITSDNTSGAEKVVLVR